MDVPITVRTFGEVERVLWEGKAKDLQNWDNIKGWIVVEVLIDKSRPEEKNLPDYNKAKIITVI